MSPADMEFLSGAIVGSGLGFTMLRNGINFVNPETRGKAAVLSLAAIAIWFVLGELLWR